eukprot:1882784-Pyramimonas_sp.AAC.1
MHAAAREVKYHVEEFGANCNPSKAAQRLKLLRAHRGNHRRLASRALSGFSELSEFYDIELM